MTALPLFPAPAPLRRLGTDDPVMARLALLIALALLPLSVAMALDPRQIAGYSIWLKPVKFHIALTIYLVTLAFFARYLRQGLLSRPGYRIHQGIVVACVIAELIWIGGAAALGTNSHFNTSSAVWTTLYSLMGAAAVTLTSASLVYGLAIWRNTASGLPQSLRLGIGSGLVLTFVLTCITAGTMSAGTGHFVGTPTDPANQLWLLGWSREVGDLRVAHFLGTHALHAIPLVAWVATLALPRVALPLTWGAIIVYATLVLATFAQALMGLPLIAG